MKDLLLVREATLCLETSFVAITGESGSGKSALMEALKLTLGAKASSKMVRSGCSLAIVESSFDLTAVKPSVLKKISSHFESHGLEVDLAELLVIKREIYTQKASRSFVNNQPASCQWIQTLGQLLVEIVGQHGSLSLNQLSEHLRLLDDFASHSEKLEAYSLFFKEYKENEKELMRLDELQLEAPEKLELYEYQYNEIEEACLKEGEEESLFETLSILSSSDTLTSEMGELSQFLDSEENPSKTLRRFTQSLSRLKLPKSFEKLKNHADSISIELDELSLSLNQLIDEVESDPAKLKEIEERLTLIRFLKKKYGSNVSAIETFKSDILEKITELKQLQLRREALIEKQSTIKEQLNKLATTLSQSRKQKAKKLSTEVSKVLNELNLPEASFEVEIRQGEFGASGIDEVEFILSPNPGEPSIPLKNGASGGEMARVMLALKATCHSKNPVATLIFDEIDANIGGQTASMLAKKLKSMSGDYQILCITHFAQVAKEAKAHLSIEKSVTQGRTETKFSRLSGKAQALELLRMEGKESSAPCKGAKKSLVVS